MSKNYQKNRDEKKIHFHKFFLDKKNSIKLFKRKNFIIIIIIIKLSIYIVRIRGFMKKNNFLKKKLICFPGIIINLKKKIVILIKLGEKSVNRWNVRR